LKTHVRGPSGPLNTAQSMNVPAPTVNAAGIPFAC
jgi:hypothetical protein